ncbi:GNAT family N-acetyltransferase [Variovorax sp. HJSM1_2]|uniref:GNAT family N-acetyltransferase n=1 Tax=Variovorax sp. HJSM1_2 TaxID=3366263 RepID=UPI003BED4F4C
MNKARAKPAKAWLHQTVRRAVSALPKAVRFRVLRSFVRCDLKPDPRLVLKIAQTRDELEACFRLLHDAYVGSGYMLPDPSGLRVTLYHALPTTTTLCALYDGQVVGTISLIRQSAFGFPMQAVFNLESVKQRKGKIAEVSALAVHPQFRQSGGAVLFPLMKFMYEYCTSCFDTHHVVIAVNPKQIDLYEALLLFERLPAPVVEKYDFVNGAPAVAAAIDLLAVPRRLRHLYGGKTPSKNLYHYFVRAQIKNIQLPKRRYYTTNHPVMTPAMLDYFFNQRTQVFSKMTEREKVKLDAIYDLPVYKDVLPFVSSASRAQMPLRQHRRFTLKVRAGLRVVVNGRELRVKLDLVELSEIGFQARAKVAVPLNVWADVSIRLGSEENSRMKVMAVRGSNGGEYHRYVFSVHQPDLAWRKFTSALMAGSTFGDLDEASRFLEDKEYQQTARGDERRYHDHLVPAWHDTDNLGLRGRHHNI